MDITTIVKDYAVLITASAGLIGIVLAYYFGKWNAERQRNWELENRDFNRQVAIHDVRIKEAREYVDTLQASIQFINHLHLILTDEPKLLEGNVKVFMTENSNAFQLAKEFIQKFSAIDILDDPELSATHEKTLSMYYSLLVNAQAIVSKFLLEDSYNIEDINVEDIRIPRELDQLLIQMKIRLDKLARAPKK